MAVVSDTSPLCYLVLIDLIDLLPELYGKVIIPQAVLNELSVPQAPEAVQAWIAQPPVWLEVQSIENPPDVELIQLDLGEQEAIALAEQLGADLIIVDDRDARQMALQRGLNVIGLLGVLGVAAQQNLINFSVAIGRLQQTTFRASPVLIESLLERFRARE
jgi:predicted nucleic acid-binding protein